MTKENRKAPVSNEHLVSETPINAKALLPTAHQSNVAECYSPRVVIIGGFGWQDLGDEAMPQAVIANLRKCLPKLNLLMFSPNPSYTEQYHHERAVYDVNAYLYSWSDNRLIRRGQRFIRGGLVVWRWLAFLVAAWFRKRNIKLPLGSKADALLDGIAQADLVFNNGGGNINSLMPRELYKQTLMLLAASILNKPVIVSGQTIGPLEGFKDRWLTRLALSKVDMLTFRDKGVSSERTRAIGVSGPVMQDTADDALTLPVLTRKEALKLVSDNGGDEWLERLYKLTVVMNLNGYFKAMGKMTLEQYEPEIALMAGLADRLIEEKGARILFVPTDVCSSADDRILHRCILDRMRWRKMALTIEKEYDAVAYKSLVHLGDIAIGSRYHFIVFSASGAVPSLCMANGLYQKTKLKGVAGLFEMDEYFIPEDMQDVSLDAAWTRVTRLLSEAPNLRCCLAERMKVLSERSLSTIRRAVELIGTGTRSAPKRSPSPSP